MAFGMAYQNAGFSPDTAAHDIRTSAVAILGRGEKRSLFGAQRQALVQWGCKNGCILQHAFLEPLKGIGVGAEHTVYHDASTGLAIKVTHPDRFGNSVSKVGAPEGASPVEYLERLHYQNKIFGDDIRVIGLFSDGNSVSVITSQRWIQTDRDTPPPGQAVIDSYLAGIGFMRSPAFPGGYIYYNPVLNLIIMDVQPPNILLTSPGILVPIDVVIGKPCPTLEIQLRGAIPGVTPPPPVALP
ncbi:MAG: hypothetical protein LBK99_26105 [Opitutaceae bacterium]|jgi:hypothetical protein|nr:hypothetical protein [Opitutaceae bacterium]